MRVTSCNFKFSDSHVKERKDTGEINFSNIFYFNQYIKVLSFQTEFSIKMKKFCVLSGEGGTESLNASVAFTFIVCLNMG